MNRGLLSTLVSATLLGACVSAPPVQNSSVEPVFDPVANGAESEVLIPVEPEVIPEPPRVVVQEPRVVEPNRNPALDSLVDQSLSFIANGDYGRAITTAERAMSIDRYDPRVYLLLAQAHRQTGNLALSRQYAERGLAVSQADSDTSRALERLRL